MEKRKTTVHKDATALCHFCGEPLFKDNKAVEALRVYKYKGENDACHNRCYLANKEISEIEVIIYSSCRAIGDTISITPIIREIKRIYPTINIDVLTYVTDVFKYNQDVRKVIPYVAGMKEDIYLKYDRKIEPFQSTNKVWPMHMLTHSVDFVSYGAFRKTLKDKHKHYYVPYTYHELDSMLKICKKKKFDPENEKFVLIHPHGAEWGTRTWKKENWVELVKRIKTYYPDYKLIGIGGSRGYYKQYEMDNFVDIPVDIDFYNKFSLLETISLMDKAHSLISMDTGPIHMAGATKCRILGIFTVVNSMYRVPYRKGIKGWRCWPVDSLECDCTYDRKFMTQNIDIGVCPNGFKDLSCHPTPGRVFRKFQEMMGGE